MGGSSRYCIICGGPFGFITYGDVIDWFNEEIVNIDEDVHKDKISLIDKMEKEIKILNTNKKSWGRRIDLELINTNGLYFITENNELVNAKSNQLIEIRFVKNGTEYKCTSLNDEDERGIIICHRECYNLLKKELDYDLVFTDVVNYINYCHIIDKFGFHINSVVKVSGYFTHPICEKHKEINFYREMEKYMDRYYLTNKLQICDKWLIDIENKRNRLRIISSWMPLIYDINAR